MTEIDLLSIQNAIFALKQIEVRGVYALSYGNAVEALEKGVKALHKAKEEAQHADHDKQE